MAATLHPLFRILAVAVLKACGVHAQNLLGVVAQGLIGVIIGIVGGIMPIATAVERFDVYFGDKDAVQEISKLPKP